MIYITSDWHFCHDQPFIYEPRGFSSVNEMNEAIVERHNLIVSNDDDVWVLGDLMLNDNEKGIELISKLNGNLHIVCGNHDTDRRKELYKTLPNFITMYDGKMLRYKKYSFMLSHFPTITTNYDDQGITYRTLSLFGHTHSKEKFYNDNPYIYNVAVDAHNCFPVSIEQIITDMKTKAKDLC